MQRLLWLVLLLPTALLAQPDTLWTRLVENAGFSALESLCSTADGGLAAAGVRAGQDSGRSEGWLMKIGLDGYPLWHRGFTRSRFEDFGRVLQTSDGGLLAAGSERIPESTFDAVLLVKTTAGGDTEWVSTLDAYTTLSGRDVSIAAAGDTGYVIGHTRMDTVSASSDLAMAKLDLEGDTVWTRHYGGPFSDFGYLVRPLSDGYVTFGRVQPSQSGDPEVMLVRTNTVGAAIWSRSFAPPSSVAHRGVGLLPTSDGGFLLGMTCEDNLGQQELLWLVRTNRQGTRMWTQSITWNFARVYDMQPTRDGGFVVAGSDSTRWMIAKFDASGTARWQQALPVPGRYGQTRLGGIVQLPDGGFAACGSTLDSTAGYTVGLVLRTAPDPDLSAAEPPAPTAVQSYRLEPCHPNPFNAATRIAFALFAPSDLMLAIYDVNGRLIRTLADGRFEAGRHELRFDGAGLATGLYFCRLRAGSAIDTQKMILLR